MRASLFGWRSRRLCPSSSMRIDGRVIAVAAALVLASPPLAGQRVNVGPDSRDLLLAALAVATIECLGTVGPEAFTTHSGVLARTFDDCPTGDAEKLLQVDALLGGQFSEQGRSDSLAEHYVRRWNAFVASFPHKRIRACPAWTLMNVIDALPMRAWPDI